MRPEWRRFVSPHVGAEEDSRDYVGERSQSRRLLVSPRDSAWAALPGDFSFWLLHLSLHVYVLVY